MRRDPSGKWELLRMAEPPRARVRGRTAWRHHHLKYRRYQWRQEAREIWRRKTEASSSLTDRLSTRRLRIYTAEIKEGWGPRKTKSSKTLTLTKMKRSLNSREAMMISRHLTYKKGADLLPKPLSDQSLDRATISCRTSTQNLSTKTLQSVSKSKKAGYPSIKKQWKLTRRLSPWSKWSSC